MSDERDREIAFLEEEERRDEKFRRLLAVFEAEEEGWWEKMDEASSTGSVSELPVSAGMLTAAAMGREERGVEDAVAYRELLAMGAYWNRADHHLTRSTIARLLLPLWLNAALLAALLLRGWM